MSWLIDGNLTQDEKLVQKRFNLKYLPMVKSLLDTDLYKFSMGQVYHNQWSSDWATWKWKARNVGTGKFYSRYTEEDLEEIINQIKAYCALRFDKDELSFLHTKFPWIHKDFVNFLSFWHPKFEDFEFSSTTDSGLDICFKGVQEYVTYYEIPLLEITAEVYYRNHFDYKKLVEDFKEVNSDKIKSLKSSSNKGVFSEFGARRRVSFELQNWLIDKLSKSNLRTFMGTSNVYLAKRYGLNAAGTMAHEFIMTVGQGHLKHNPAYSNWYALESWTKEYGVWNGIALTDTIGTDIFLRDFGKTWCTVFSGVRHDSGDPIEWGEKIISHYENNGINPETKTLLFSDGLNWTIADKLYNHFQDRIKVAFGIGTDWSGPQKDTALNIVAKPVMINGLHVAKLSDSEGKNMCQSEQAITRLKSEIKWRLSVGK